MQVFFSILLIQNPKFSFLFIKLLTEILCVFLWLAFSFVLLYIMFVFRLPFSHLNHLQLHVFQYLYWTKKRTRRMVAENDEIIVLKTVLCSIENKLGWRENEKFLCSFNWKYKLYFFLNFCSAIYARYLVCCTTRNHSCLFLFMHLRRNTIFIRNTLYRCTTHCIMQACQLSSAKNEYI